jgi:hypothetical protein
VCVVEASFGLFFWAKIQHLSRESLAFFLPSFYARQNSWAKIQRGSRRVWRGKVKKITCRLALKETGICLSVFKYAQINTYFS